MKPYDPKDGVHYNYFTTTKGILEKENPEDREFVVPAKLKELIEKKDYEMCIRDSYNPSLQFPIL